MPIFGVIKGHCNGCGRPRDWFIKSSSVVCAGCGRKRSGIGMPLQGVISAHCNGCGGRRDWVVGAKGNYRCLGCDRYR